jgi:hypothetical protein
VTDERSPAFQAALRKLLAQREVAHAWDVFRDWALDEGHARGELMALDAELEATRTSLSTSARVERERASFFSRHRSHFLGRDQLLGDLQLTWRRGFISRAVVPNAGVHLDCLRELSTHVSGALLEALECSPRELHTYLEAGSRELRALTLRAPAPQPGEVNFDGASGRRTPREHQEPIDDEQSLSADALPFLEELTIQGPITLDLGRFSSTRLRELVFVRLAYTDLNIANITSILDRCSAVERFVPDATAPASLRVVFERRLQTLELNEFTDETARVLLESPLHVGTLDLRSFDASARQFEALSVWLRTEPRVRRVLVARSAPPLIRSQVKGFNTRKLPPRPR